MTFEAWIMLAILIVLFGFLVWNKLPAWIVFIGALTVTMTLGLAPERELLQGFASPAVATVGVLFTVAAGMYSTGAITLIADKFIGLPKTLSKAQLKILPPVAISSAFLNNTPLVAMMIPVVRDIGHTARLAISKLLIPVSFASILGGAATVIGTSDNLVIAGLVAFSSLRRTWSDHAVVRPIAGRPRRHLDTATSRAQRIADNRSSVPNQSSILFCLDEVKNERCKRF